MIEWLFDIFAQYPGYTYLAVGLIFLLCGLGLPAPEEIVLVIAGWLCHKGQADLSLMILSCSVAILLGDLLPFTAGRLFGPRILRLRWMRIVVNKQRLATFDRWFRRRGDMVILVARFVPGLRVVAFFTGGTMRMRWSRFLFLDVCGIAITAPLFVWLGSHFGGQIDEAIRWVQQAERGILISAGVAGLAFGVWYWLRRRDRRRRLVDGPRETFVEPSKAPNRPPAPDLESPPATGSAKESAPDAHCPPDALPTAPPEPVADPPDPSPDPAGPRQPKADS